jgi:uncharacterized protein involved in high-affinity Fe2+ transport
MIEMDGKKYINISKRKTGYSYYYLSFKNSFFNDNEFFIEIDENKIIFNRAHIDFQGRTYKATKIRYDWFYFGYSSEFLRVGSFYIDQEESNNDRIVVYFEDIREK